MGFEASIARVKKISLNRQNVLKGTFCVLTIDRTLNIILIKNNPIFVKTIFPSKHWIRKRVSTLWIRTQILLLTFFISLIFEALKF